MVHIIYNKKIIIATLSLILSVPTLSFGNSDANYIRTHKAPIEKWYGNDILMTDDTQTKCQELKIKYKDGEITKEQFHEEMRKLKPDRNKNKQKYYKKLNLSEEEKLKLQELKVKLKSGEITKDQFFEELKVIRPEGFKNKRFNKDSFNLNSQ